MFEEENASTDDIIMSASDFHVRIFDTQMRRHGRRGRWEVSCNGSEFVPFPVRNLGAFVHELTVSVVEKLVKNSVNKHVVVAEQTAVRLHVAGAVNLRDARVYDGRLWIPQVQFGDCSAPVLIVPTNKPAPDLAFSFAVVGPRHLYLV